MVLDERYASISLGLLEEIFMCDDSKVNAIEQRRTCGDRVF